MGSTKYCGWQDIVCVAYYPLSSTNEIFSICIDLLLQYQPLYYKESLFPTDDYFSASPPTANGNQVFSISLQNKF